MYYFQFQFDSTVYRIQSAQPEQLWDPIHNHLSISSEYLTDNSLKKEGILRRAHVLWHGSAISPRYSLLSMFDQRWAQLPDRTSMVEAFEF
jgi:hypothetical protein